MSLKVYSTLAGFLGIGLGLIGGFITRDEMKYPSQNRIEEIYEAYLQNNKKK
ncbi:hypothetical protein pb186bvf_005381 [Paramecium bursaria]